VPSLAAAAMSKVLSEKEATQLHSRSSALDVFTSSRVELERNITVQYRHLPWNTEGIAATLLDVSGHRDFTVGARLLNASAELFALRAEKHSHRALVR
jgi:translation elongation factor EF-1alpha